MNFLFFAGGSYVGGMEVVIQSLMVQLNDSGHRTFAVVSGWNNGDYPVRLQSAGVEVAEVKLGKFYRSRPLWTLDALRHLPSAAWQLRQLAKDFSPDAVIYPDLQLLIIGSAVLPRLKSVFYEHNDPLGHNSPRMISMVNKRAHRIVCVSEFVADRARRAAFESAKISIVHNGIGPPKRAVVSSAPNDPVRLGIVGQLLPRKQHHVLITALATLRAQHPDLPFRLKIIGANNNEYSQAINELVGRAKMQDVVDWTGFVKHRDQIYDQLDAVIAPALDEPFGMTVLEAGAYGLPIVAARSGGIAELVVDGKTGLLFDAGNPDALMLVIAKLLSDRQLHVRLGQAGQAHVLTRFSMKRMAEKFVEAVDSRLP